MAEVCWYTRDSADLVLGVCGSTSWTSRSWIVGWQPTIRTLWWRHPLTMMDRRGTRWRARWRRRRSTRSGLCTMWRRSTLWRLWRRRPGNVQAGLLWPLRRNIPDQLAPEGWQPLPLRHVTTLAGSSRGRTASTLAAMTSRGRTASSLAWARRSWWPGWRCLRKHRRNKTRSWVRSKEFVKLVAPDNRVGRH